MRAVSRGCARAVGVLGASGWRTFALDDVVSAVKRASAVLWRAASSSKASTSGSHLESGPQDTRLAMGPALGRPACGFNRAGVACALTRFRLRPSLSIWGGRVDGYEIVGDPSGPRPPTHTPRRPPPHPGGRLPLPISSSSSRRWRGTSPATRATAEEEHAHGEIRGNGGERIQQSLLKRRRHRRFRTTMTSTLDHRRVHMMNTQPLHCQRRLGEL